MGIDMSELKCVFAHKGKTVFVALPKELWKLAGNCDCEYCQGKPAWYDTMGIDITGNNHPTWVTHYPELHQKK